MCAVASFLLSVTLLAFSTPVFAQMVDHGELFAKAHSLYSSGSYHQAKELFQKTLDPKFILADYSLFFLGNIALNEKNWDASRQLFAELKEKYPQSIWASSAELQRAKID